MADPRLRLPTARRGEGAGEREGEGGGEVERKGRARRYGFGGSGRRGTSMEWVVEEGIRRRRRSGNVRVEGFVTREVRVGSEGAACGGDGGDGRIATVTGKGEDQWV
ncbi:hypothetical protein E2C01_081006 [Portunus trituberculatus]|uniref:Uncharacterized protein n=1 Tax=Portunus trituberculatus TaxID=210409 RepID=A0A5B7IL39_PORTR|nr:hypothetical protein [Portunus trituberculatus]